MEGSLFVLAGAPGSGKTAVAPGVRAALPGVVVLDMDEFLDAGSRLAGLDLRSPAAADRWPAHNDLCLTFVAAVLAGGHDVLLLCPLTPEEVRRSTAAPALGAVRWAVLDCSDATRRHRLGTRPDVDDHGAMADAAGLRALELPVLHNDGITLDAAVDMIAASWRSRRRLGRPDEPGANRWSSVTIDCLDPERVARFWSALLGREPGPSQAGWVYLGARSDPQPRLVFQPVPEPATGKVRIHLDVTVEDIENSMAAVLSLGGRSTGERHDYDEGVVVVMADPENHEFCLVQYHD